MSQVADGGHSCFSVRARTVLLPFKSMTRAIFTAAALLLLGVGAGSAQLPFDTDVGRSELTRDDLERRLAYYEDVLRSPGYSSRVRELARADMERIRVRLTEGDFRPGDRIAPYVQGEENLPDTIGVEVGPIVALPLFGEVDLTGVLRSEIQARLTEHLSGYIREPVVRASGLMRVAVQGQVGQAGFYWVPGDVLIDEVLMLAGGPGGSADMEHMSIERGSEVLMRDEDLQEAIRIGLTLDQLNMQAGDQIVLPERGQGFLTNIGVIAGLLGTVAFAIVQIAR